MRADKHARALVHKSTRARTRTRMQPHDVFKRSSDCPCVQAIDKDEALERLEGKHIGKLKDLERIQMNAVRTASSAVEAEDSIVHHKSSHIHSLMQQVNP